ncbi:hypothetical protein [Mariniluteicoccus flavus]
MPRKLSIPGTSDLLQSGVTADHVMADPEPTADRVTPQPSPGAARRSSGRVRHDEKITVYVSRDELVRLEQARLTLRAEHGVAVDRGRIVREAVAAYLDDLQENGEDSELLRRLQGS